MKNLLPPWFVLFSLTFWTPAERVAILDSLAVHVFALMKVIAHGQDGKGRGVLAKEEEILAPPPAVGILDAENLDWKILFHKLYAFFVFGLF